MQASIKKRWLRHERSRPPCPCCLLGLEQQHDLPCSCLWSEYNDTPDSDVAPAGNVKEDATWRPDAGHTRNATPPTCVTLSLETL